tara:strand:+ start:624 stop:1019 length:396 start_codon:yes stop_codon:yes gene_type:complete
VVAFTRFLALLAILSLASMPFGYMPDRDADGALVLRICDGTMPMAEPHGDGASAMSMSMHAMPDGAHGPEDDGGKHETRCNYAVAGIAAMPDAPVLADVAVRIDHYPRALPAPLTGLFPPHMPPATGPPSV